MEIALIFFAVVAIHAAISLVHYRAGVFLAIVLYSIYPKFLSLGLSDEGFALTGQRAMLSVLFGIYVLRVLWGSAEVQRGLKLMTRYKLIMYSLIVFVLARLIGNFASGRIDIGSFAAFISETLLSAFIVALILTYISNRQDIVKLLTVVLASLLLNQFASVYEFYTDSSIYSSSIEIQYETNRSEEAMLEGMVREESYRAMGFFDNSLKLASLLCMTLPFAMFLSVYGANTLTRVFAALSVAMAIPTAFFTGSRTAIGIMIIIFGWYMYRLVSRGMSRIGRRTLFTCSLPLAAIFIVTATSGIIDEILFGDIYARSTDARWTQFITVPIFIAEYPMFGRGYARNIGEVISMATLDSFYLRITLEGGVVALLALAVFLFRGSRILFPLSKTDHGDFDTSLAKALRVSTGISAILMIVFSLAYVRMYVFMAVAIAVVLHSLCSKNNATGPITDAGPTLPQSQPVKQ